MGLMAASNNGKLKRAILWINGGAAVDITFAIKSGSINVSNILPLKICKKLTLDNFVWSGNYGFTTYWNPDNNFAVFTPTSYNPSTGVLSYTYQSTYDGIIKHASFIVFYIE